MAILNITTDVTGLVGVNPSWIYIDTDDTVAAVTAVGYLSNVPVGGTFSNTQVALVNTSDAGIIECKVSVSRTNVVSLKLSQGSFRVSWSGGSASHAFTVPGVVAASIVTASIVSEANASYILTAAPGAGVVTVTFNTDPGAVVVNFIVGSAT